MGKKEMLMLKTLLIKKEEKKYIYLDFHRLTPSFKACLDSLIRGLASCWKCISTVGGQAGLETRSNDQDDENLGMYS